MLPWIEWDQKLTRNASSSTRSSSCPLTEVLVGFSFPEKKTGKEKKNKKMPTEGESAADSFAEVHKKKKKVCGRPGAGCHGNSHSEEHL